MVSICFQCVLFGINAGMKEVTKELHKICAGRVRARGGRTWFTEHPTRICSFWKYLLSMEYLTIQQEAPKCTSIGARGNPDRLCAMNMNINKHFQVSVCT